MVKTDSTNMTIMSLSYLGNLHTPVEQVLGADVVFVLLDIVQQAAVGHELSDELHRGGQADAEQPAHMRMVHACHHISLLRTRSTDVQGYMSEVLKRGRENRSLHILLHLSSASWSTAHSGN